ncbi:MAG TPA: glycoside hydrolase family 32 protein [Candidatus Sulfotelmatobacter sp.]|nr:glycoside hydrolase family 32 protein [Candidatus Sulfotelmatobacter sp.]
MSLTRRSFLQLSAVAALQRALPSTASQETRSSLCRKLANDPLRPQYHLLPAHNWMNDPNGPIYFDGRYHMFHQYNPQGATWGHMNWAHATSPDMFRWEHEPIALSPTPGGPDQDGVFSGSAVLDNGKPTVIYTGVAPPSGKNATLRDGSHIWRETQCLAVARDRELRSWKKLPQPVIAAPPAGLDVTGFRDPALWREGDKWMLILGSGIRGKGGAVLLYSSSDLRQWSYLHPLVEGIASGKETANPVDTGDMWECPDFFPLGNKYVLLISTMGKVRWKVGTYENQRFTPEKEGVVDGGSYYAAKTMLDKNGRRILWGWITESRPDADLIAAGWAGAMSLPRVLSLSPDNELQTGVAPDVSVLRGARIDHPRAESSLGNVQIRDLAAELDLRFQSPSVHFKLHLYSDAGDFCSIDYADESGGRILRVNDLTCPVPVKRGSEFRLHIFLDGSVMEIFLDDLTAITVRVYKIPSGPLRLKLESDAKILSVAGWQMTPISRNRLTSPLCSG